MDTCKYTHRLSAYHDGEVRGDERVALETHLRTCPACREELERLRRLSRLVATAGRVDLPDATRARLHRAVDEAASADLGRMAKALLALAASVLLVCGLWLWQANGAERTDSIPVWETVAAQGRSAAGGTREQLAQWILCDLERTNGHDAD